MDADISQIPSSTHVTRRELRSQQVTRLVGYLCIACGGIYLIAWPLGCEFVRGDRSVLLNMKANTAICIAVAGVGLALSTRRNGRTRTARGTQICGVFVLAIGLLTLAQYVFNVDLGIDQMIYAEPVGALGTTSPGRMGPPATISWCLIGLGLILLDRKLKALVLSQAVACAGLVVAFLPLLGYGFQAVSLYSTAGATAIALPTAALLLLINLGIIAARPCIGLMKLVVAEDAGGYVIRQLLLPTILVPCIMGLLVRIGEREGWVTAAFGDALLVIVLIVVLTAVKFQRAAVLSVIDQRRTRAEAELANQLAFATTAQAELVDRDDRLREVADTAAAMIWMADGHGHITFRNESFLTFAGTGAETEIDTWFDRIHQEDRDAFRSAFKSCFDKQQPFRGVARAGRPDGTFRWIDVICQPRVNREGRFRGYVCTAQDVTESKEFTLERESLLASERAARSQLEHASRMKDEFLSTLSHELRTPLSAVLGWTQLLRRRDGNDPMLMEGLETIERGARTQVQLIEDLLDLSRIASGKVRLSLQSLDLRRVVEAALEIVRPSAEVKRIRLVAAFDHNVPSVSGDATRLQQVVWNLLANAIKFTPAGGEVSVSLKERDGQVEATVQDSGQGIDPEFLPRVFDRFSQADSKPSRKHGGLGIGLALVKQIVELHGGLVSAASPGVGHGATFTLRLPTASPDLLPLFPTLDLPSSQAPFSNDVSLAGVTALIVDDDPGARDVLARLLAQFKATTISVGSAQEAIDKLAEVRPDLLISDIGMPDMDGFELMRRLRASGQRLPAIALTAFARPEDRIACLKAGYDMHLSKPVDPRELLAVVASVTRMARANQ